MNETPDYDMPQHIVCERMADLIGSWTATGDRRAAFLRCYYMMTSNMLEAVREGEFHDGPWVEKLIVRFADYYFDALESYERDPATPPTVWQYAHNSASGDGFVVQLLLLGINAHINYDLVLALVDLLDDEWPRLDSAVRSERRSDYAYVNDVIARTVDAVQDEVVEAEAPAMDVVDQLLGPLDEWMISSLLTRWRDEVWDFALDMLRTVDATERERIRSTVESLALRRADAIMLRPGARNLLSIV